MWQFEEVMHNYCKHRNTALSFEYLICSFITLDHLSLQLCALWWHPSLQKSIGVHDNVDTTMIYSIFRKLCIGYPPLDVRYMSV